MDHLVTNISFNPYLKLRFTNVCKHEPRTVIESMATFGFQFVGRHGILEFPSQEICHFRQTVRQ